MDDRMNLDSWEQQVEYSRVRSWGREFNNAKKETTAKELVEEVCNESE